ncbi:MAG: Ig-like domain-containing protein, partial [Pirellulaceae bacterium]
DGTKQTALAEVLVQKADRAMVWEFGNHIEAVLSRNGCNMGACHGALAGKGGFRLSLRGYDPELDFHNITRQDRGRRVELRDPLRSLLLAKPSGDLEHRGGIRLRPEGHDYRVLAEWIAAGAPDTLAEEPALERIEVLPERVWLSPGAQQSILVRAHYANGRIEDVTHWAKFSSSDEGVATVDENGRVQVVGPGEGAIAVWFASRIAMSRLAVPYTTELDPMVFQQFPLANVIDEKMRQQW